MSMPRKVRCTVRSIVNHGGRVYTIELNAHSLVPGFKPGQFLHLTVDGYDPSGFWPESRVFSIASSPRERDRIRICYSVKGSYTTKMEQLLKVGSEVWIKLPYGDFIIDDSGDAFLIAGGTGISAFTAFIEALTPQNFRTVTLVYGARTPDLFLFRDQILAQLASVPKLKLFFFTEAQDVAFASEMSALSPAPVCLTGRISLSTILRTPAPQIPRRSTVYFLAGPPVMLTTLTAELQSLGIQPDMIRTDAWE